MSQKGQKIFSFINQFTTLLLKLEHIEENAGIFEMLKKPVFWTPIDAHCSLKSIAVSLQTKEVSKRTWNLVGATHIKDYSKHLEASAHSEENGFSQTWNKHKSLQEHLRYDGWWGPWGKKCLWIWTKQSSVFSCTKVAHIFMILFKTNCKVFEKMDTSKVVASWNR